MVKIFSIGYKISLADTFTEENERGMRLDTWKYAYYSNNWVVRVAVWLKWQRTGLDQRSYSTWDPISTVFLTPWYWDR